MKTRILQFLIILTPFVLFFWLLWLDIVPTGQKVVVYLAGEDSPYINHPLPDDRVEYFLDVGKENKYVRLIDDPVYFSVDLPQTDFDTVSVELEYENHGLNIFELGALVDPVSDAFDLRPVENTLIDQSDWHKIEDQGTTLLDRTGKITSIYDFLDEPNLEHLATYHYELSLPYREANYQPLGHSQTFTTSLRGYQQYLTYLKNETFSLDLVYSDVNRTLGIDEVFVRVYSETGSLVYEDNRADDGNDGDNQEDSKHDIQVKIDNLPEGVYRVELSGTSDIFWRELTTGQRYMSFIDRLYLGDNVGYKDGLIESKAYTNATNLTFETVHTEGIQTLQVNGQPVEIATTHEKVEYRVPKSDFAVISIPSSDIKISGRGKYSLSAESFFDPEPITLTDAIDLDESQINYVLADYISPNEADGWLVSATNPQLEFDLSKIRQRDNTAKFILSVPGVDDDSWIDVHQIKLTFKKKPLTTKEFLEALVDRFPFGL